MKRVLIAIAWVAVTALAYSQVFTANLTGVVTDPGGAGVPNAKIVLKNVESGEQRQAATNVEGRYTFSQLLPGQYELRAQAVGFEAFVQRDIVLRTNQSAAIDVALKLGEVTERVEVAGAAVQLDTQTANQSMTLSERLVSSLPISNRTPMSLAFATAGVTSLTNMNLGTPGADQNYSRIGLNGGRDVTSLILLDGVSANSGLTWNQLMYSPAIDSVEEFQVNRNTYDAQYGRSGGGVISMVTKSGTSQFHGLAYDYLSNSALNANSWAADRAGQPKPGFQQNVFGGNAGGPIVRARRVFFFVGYEGVRQGSPVTSVLNLPTAQQRQGDFSQTYNANGTLSAIYNPFSIRPNPNGSGSIRDPFPANVIPASLLDPVGVKAAAQYPLPNSPGAPLTHANDYVASGKSTNTTDRADIRVDWAHNEKHTLYARFSRAFRLDAVPPPNVWQSYTTTGPFSQNRRDNSTFGNTFMFGPSFVVNVLAAHSRFVAVQESPTAGQDGTAIGLPASLVSQFDTKDIPWFGMSGYSNIGETRQQNLIYQTDSLQVNATKEIRGHSLKFGFSVEADKFLGAGVLAAEFSFNRGMTSGPVAATNSTVSGDAVASLLLGTGASGDVPKTILPAENRNYFAGYMQDSWHLTRRLTLTPGLRYDVQRPPTERYNRANVFSYTVVNPLGAEVGLPLRGGLEFLNSNSRFPWDTNWLNFAPRIGLAYKLTDKLVVRSGYGIFYALNRGDISTAGYSNSTPWVSSRGGDGITPQDLLRNPFPQGLVPFVGSSLGLATNLGLGVGSLQRINPNPRIQQYSLDFQYEINRSTIAQISYAGNQGRKLGYGVAINDNQLPTNLLSMGSALDRQAPNPFYGYITSGTLAGPTIPANQLLRPFPEFASVTRGTETPGGSSSYNALVAQLSRQFSGGLLVLVSYQWSKALDNLGEDEPGITDVAYQDYTNLRPARSISAHDIPQSFRTSFVYDLPVGKGQKFGGLPRAANFILGGWQVSGIVSLQSGLPYQVTAPNTIGQYGFGSQYPNICSSCDLALTNRTPERWFNTSAFSVAAPYTLGVAARRYTQLRQAGTKTADIALGKNWSPKEPWRLQFRAQLYNLTNTPQFNAPGAALGTTTFGLVNATRPPRTVELALKLNF